MKFLIYTFFVFVAVLPATAQDLEVSAFNKDQVVVARLGFQVGYANYSLTGNEVDLRTNRGAELQARTGVHLGGVYQLELFKYFYLKSGLNYLQKGGELVGGGWVHKGPVKVNYINVPLVAGVTPLRSEKIQISFEGGVAYNLLTSSKIPYTDDLVENYYARQEANITSLVLGMEAAYLISDSKRFFINYRHSKDTHYFHARIYRPTGLTYDLNNQGYSLTAGFLYTLKNKK